MSPLLEPAGVRVERKYKGVRRLRRGKWVSEIRVSGTQERLWLGTYSMPEGTAVAHDTAVFFLRGPESARGRLNFPDRVAAAFSWARLSPPSIQRVASDAGMAVDALLVRPCGGSSPAENVNGEQACSGGGGGRWRCVL